MVVWPACYQPVWVPLIGLVWRTLHLQFLIWDCQSNQFVSTYLKYKYNCLTQSFSKLCRHPMQHTAKLIGQWIALGLLLRSGCYLRPAPSNYLQQWLWTNSSLGVYSVYILLAGGVMTLLCKSKGLDSNTFCSTNRNSTANSNSSQTPT